MANVQGIIDIATSTNSTSLGSATASEIFRTTYNNSIKVTVHLKQRDKEHLQSLCNFPLVFIGGKTVTNDHPLLVAMRDIIRDTFENEYKISKTNERTLIVGAAAREIRQYNANPHIHYYIYGKETKDYDRIIRPALTDISAMLKKKACKTNRDVFILPSEPNKMRGVLKRYWDMKGVFEDYMTLHKMPANIHTEEIEANTLIFEDSIYNFGQKELCEIFYKTSAQIAYGYALLPYELLFDNMANNPIYNFTKCDKDSILTFINGYCNGYRHNTEQWSTLLQHPVIRHKDYPGVILAVELSSRVGPMTCFKIMRVKNADHIVRAIQLPENLKFVRVLNIHDSMDFKTGRATKPLKYISIRETEFYDTFNYALSLDVKSLTYTNLVNFIRRRMGGISLVTAELVAPWSLNRRDVTTLALTTLLYVKMHHDFNQRIKENIDIGSVFEKFKSLIRRTIRCMFWPITDLIDWIMAGNLVHQLILHPDDTAFQSTSIPKLDIMTPPVGLYLDNPYDGDVPSCPVCLSFMGKLGDQIIECKHVDAESVELTLTHDEIKTLETQLIDTDNDPVGLKNVKERAKKNMPTSGFTHKAKVYLIKCGPGCGKSYGIRQIADQSDLILAPFTKLRADYTDLTDQNNDKYDLNFKTAHRAMETRGCRRIFVDEFTSLPYEYLACIAYLNSAEEIYLVGDPKQTKVQEPDEGIYIGNRIKFDSISQHSFLVNFRNPKDTVAILNKVYGYTMRAASDIERSIEFVNMDGLPELSNALKMAFTSNTAKELCANDKCTVRANQGGTTKTSVVYLKTSDITTMSVESLQIVALSRHTEKCYIVHDGGEAVNQLKEKLQLNADFYQHIQQYLDFPNLDTKEEIRQDASVDVVIQPLHPPKDSYLLLDTFLPTAAFNPDGTSMNHVTSAMFPNNFVSGKFSSDMLLVPSNKRNHPIAVKEKFYAFGTGIGNAFWAKNPIQTLQVLQARYFCKQISFPFMEPQKLIANKMVNLWFEDSMSEKFLTKRGTLFDDYEIQEVINKFVKDITSKNYMQSFQGAGGIDNPDGRVIRFQLKGIFKPKTGTPDVYKAGQGISAWSIDACAMFCSVFRLLTKMVAKYEKANVVTDSYMAEDEFINNVNVQYKKLPKTAMNGTTDGITFDANQNSWTQYLEMTYWKKMGVTQEFLDHYYSFRKQYKIISSAAIGYAGTQKTSGEPGTLVNNGVVSKVTSNYVLRGEGPMVTVYKGDDFSKRQQNLVIDEDRMRELNSCCNLGLRCDISNSSEFCGLLFADGHLFPSIPRKVNKISAHKFKSYKHWCEYQCSLRNWCKLITKYGSEIVVACNAKHYKSTVDEMQGAMDCIVSFSHIREDQYLTMIQTYDISFVIPKMDQSKFDPIEA